MYKSFDFPDDGSAFKICFGLSTEFVGEIQTEKSVIRKLLNGGSTVSIYITPENGIANPMY